MKKLVVLALLSLLATTAFAGLDPDPDMLGLYFDTAGETVCTTAAFISHVNMYVLLTNPTIPSVRGFECSLDKPAGTNSAFTVTFPVANINVGVAPSIIVGFSVPVPTSAATVMATVDVFVLDGALDIFLNPASPESPPLNGLPKVVREDFTIMSVGTSTNGGVAAQINAPACMVVDNEDASFGAVKALFR